MGTQADLDWMAAGERAHIAAPWKLFVGDASASIGIGHFGASADYKKPYRGVRYYAERVAAAARESLARATD